MQMVVLRLNWSDGTWVLVAHSLEVRLIQTDSRGQTVGPDNARVLNASSHVELFTFVVPAASGTQATPFSLQKPSPKIWSKEAEAMDSTATTAAHAAGSIPKK
jgi:hypothetical protein